MCSVNDMFHREVCQEEVEAALAEKRAREAALEAQRQKELQRQRRIAALAQQVV
jgi:hypothetical protein